ncbi:winged helix-turn-helix domain-containing protein [Acidovorax sp. JHL-9]|uniref:winged helix-turn-helix domain-containing tetratricopeptide repeat protein n=1 Tax=Acidovorax sp. JHL-9 TaxID=1276756 RepID=UPI00041B0CC9|nr:winged helix-turn-helix domain-containing protein [Acidovorax sp. JHL-9]
MLLTFRDCELDTRLFTLRCQGQPRQVEPQVFDLLAYLLQHRHRIVPRQELLDALWAGKVVSESALSSCIKAARQAIGDSGTAQACIATVQRRGYRFVAAVAECEPPIPLRQGEPGAGPELPLDTARDAHPHRASIAVMPFADLSPVAGARGSTADALAHDVITRLAQLRSLFVIAQGTMFALHERDIGPQEAARLLDVDYVVSGTVRRHAQRLVVTAELVEVRTAHVVWADIFDRPLDDAFSVLDDIGSQIVAIAASEIELAERNRALLRPPNTLDAWEAHHRGLWHMYRFNQADNERARQFFAMAVHLDPTFARAYAGLSFTHFQNAFQGWSERAAACDQAMATARQSLDADDRNPAAHWAMGRALWLRAQQDSAVVELEQAIHLSPSFALGHYTLAFVQSQAGDPQAAIAASDHSRLLSPFDPLLFGMLGARAMALVRLGRFDEAADWAVKAAARPNAHAHIRAIAAYSLALAGSLDLARTYATAIRQARPSYQADDFFAAFRFDPQGTALFRQGAARIGMA